MTDDLLIIGGGPAGMSAAIEAATHGLVCTIVDESAALGGQIYRPLAVKPNGQTPAATVVRGDELRDQVQQLSQLINIRSESVVWGISKGNKFAVGKEGEGTEILEPKLTLLAPGAYEFVPPFPGWTLPGVMTPGAAQILSKTMNISPGKRVLIAGTGPLLIVIASQLVSNGVEVAGVIEASRQPDWLRLAIRGYRSWGLLREGARCLNTLRKAGVPVHYGRVVTRAEGKDFVQRVYHAPVNADWYPDFSGEQIESVDTLCIGYGLQPRNYLAQLAGCEMQYVDARNSWLPVRDRDLWTSQPGILAAGDGAGVAGAMTAESEGQLAGLVAANKLGKIDESAFDRLRAPIDAKLSRLAPFQKAIADICRIRPGLSSLVDDDTIVCRCEEVTWGEVNAAIDHGGTTFRSLKVMTRLGMGMCQARFCWPAMSRMVASKKNCPVADVGPARPQAPIRPVPLGLIASIPKVPETCE